jgi:hypothetical protein
MTPHNQQETLRFLSDHQLPYVSVDMPQGYPSSIPPVLAATAGLAVVWLHGHSDRWTSKDIHERFGVPLQRARAHRVGAEDRAAGRHRRDHSRAV